MVEADSYLKGRAQQFATGGLTNTEMLGITPTEFKAVTQIADGINQRNIVNFGTELAAPVSGPVDLRVALPVNKIAETAITTAQIHPTINRFNSKLNRVRRDLENAFDGLINRGAEIISRSLLNKNFRRVAAAGLLAATIGSALLKEQSSVDAQTQQAMFQVVGVGTFDSFQDAIEVANKKLGNDEIRASIGTSVISSTVPGFPVMAYINLPDMNGNLKVSGGWNANFSSQTDDFTVLDAQNNALGVFISGNGPDLEFSNFQIQNGAALGSITNESIFNGGGMTLLSTDAHIHDVRLENNQAQWFGGGMYVSLSGSANLENITLVGNHAYQGGAAEFVQSPVTLKNILSIGNSADQSPGISMSNCYNVTIFNLTSIGNKATYAYDAGLVINGGGGLLTNSLYKDESFGFIRNGGSGNPFVVEGVRYENIDAQFQAGSGPVILYDVSEGSLHLDSTGHIMDVNSDAVNEVKNSHALPYDIDGQPRTGISDFGADEYVEVIPTSTTTATRTSTPTRTETATSTVTSTGAVVTESPTVPVTVTPTSTGDVGGGMKFQIFVPQVQNGEPNQSNGITKSYATDSSQTGWDTTMTGTGVYFKSSVE